MPRDSAAADRPASYLVGTAAAFPLFFRDRTKPINQLPFSPSAKFPKSGSSCESRVKRDLIKMPFVADPRQATTDLVGERLTELARPLSYSFMADDDATGGQQLL